MSFYYQSGEGLNLLARAAAVKAPTTNATFDANFPIGALYDGRPSVYAKLGTLAAFRSVTFDLNLLQGGDAEVDFDSSWVSYSSTGTPTITRDPTLPCSGTYSHRIQLTVASGNHYAGKCRFLRFRAGEKLRLYHAGGGAVGTSVSILVYHIETGAYIASATHNIGNWTGGYVDFVMPSAEAGGGLWQRVQVFLQGNVTGGTTIDVGVEAKIVSGWDTVVMLGHTMTPAVGLLVAYQALTGNDPEDAWVADSYPTWLKTVVSGSIPDDEWDQQAVWNKSTTTRYERWVRFYLTRAAWNPTCAVGELILCQAETLARAPRLQVSDAYEGTGQIRHESGAGDPWTYNRTAVPRHRITLRYQTADDPMPGPSADERAIRRMFSGRTHSGLYPVLVIPYGTHDSRAVIYGQTQSVFGVEHLPPERMMEVEILEYPIPGLHPGLFSV